MKSAAPVQRGGFNLFQFLVDWEAAARRLQGKRHTVTDKVIVAGFALAVLGQLAKACCHRLGSSDRGRFSKIQEQATARGTGWRPHLS